MAERFQTAVDRPAFRPAEAPQQGRPPDEIHLDLAARLDVHDALYSPLKDAEGLELPACRRLLTLLSPITWAFGPHKNDPTIVDDRPPAQAARDELAREIALRSRRLRRP